MAVKCDKDEINVVLHTNGPSSHYPGSVYLNDPTCKPIYQNSTHIFVKSRLGDCGTRSNVSKDGKWILYRNAIHIDSKKHQPIGSHVTRDQQMAFEFRCSYRRRTLVSAVSFNASKVVVINVGKMFIVRSFSECSMIAGPKNLETRQVEAAREVRRVGQFRETLAKA